jgi:hypothetical protein
MSCVYLDGISTIRVTRLDSCGLPLAGPDNGFVFDCIASLTMASEVDEGTDRIYKSGTGRICATKKACPQLQWYTVTLSIGAISPEFIDLVTGQPRVLGFDGEPIGWDDCQYDCPGPGFGLEWWAPTIGGVCDDNQPSFLYGLLPWVTNGTIGDIELQDDVTEVEYTGTTQAGGQWGTGPYNVIETDAAGTPGRLLTPLGSTCHRRVFTTRVAPPTASATCDYIVVPPLVP